MIPPTMSASTDREVKVPHRASGVGRLGTTAAWISAVCCLPYLVLKVLWTVDVPLGITDRSLLDSSGWVAGNGFMAVLQLAGLLLTLALTRRWARSLPAWLLLFPVWVGIGLLFPVAVGAVLSGLLTSSSQVSSANLGGIAPWVFVMVYGAFAGQGVALAIAFACYLRTRWGPLLGERTGEVLARRTAQARLWPQRHLAPMAWVVAATAAVVGLVYAYWAAGGSFGLTVQPHPSRALQAASVVGAFIAAAGLLGLAGTWGHRVRFWLPAALAWVGSGALTAFDGLTLTLNRLFVVFGAAASPPDWSLADTVALIKVLVGVLTAAVGAVAITAAARRASE